MGLLVDVVRRETSNRSIRFADALGASARGRVPTRPRFVHAAPLMVLRSVDTPSVLLETGYLSNPDDLARLTSASGRRDLALSVADAVSEWIGIRAGGASATGHRRRTSIPAR